jgi:hypothetical protein
VQILMARWPYCRPSHPICLPPSAKTSVSRILHRPQVRNALMTSCPPLHLTHRQRLNRPISYPLSQKQKKSLHSLIPWNQTCLRCLDYVSGPWPSVAVAKTV